MSASVLLGTDRLVTGLGQWSPGWVSVRDGFIVESGGGTPPGPVTDHVGEAIIPGFVDIHAHGAAGADFGSADADGIRSIVDHHARHGSTRLVASLASAPLDALERGIAELRPFVESGELAGIHLEGPYLSPERRGAHDPGLLRLPELGEIARLIARGGGAVRMVTIAPELVGAEPVIRWLVDNGVTVALGHSDCDADTARAALGWGATMVTHLFNGMRPLHHRQPGLVGVALVDERATVELILDGGHVSVDVAEIVRRTAGNRLVLVSDAMAATGCGDGDYEIAGSPVRVRDGVAMLSDGSSLAGSTITVSDGFRLLVESLGSSLAAAVQATSAGPADALGLGDATLVAGAPADLLVLDGSTVTRVMRRGSWLESS